MSRIVGIDISLTGTGLACSCGSVEVKGRDGITKLPLAKRVDVIERLSAGICGWTLKHQADLAVIEQPAFSRSGGGSLERHALWWHVVENLIGCDIQVAEVPATTLKRYATGKGNAQKGPMLDALARRLPMFETGGNDNLVDAAWLAAFGADHLGMPLAEMPAANRAALAKVSWPEVAR